MLFEFWTWWYGVGWSEVANRVVKRAAGVWQLFSVGILLRTLFFPWKRIVTPPGKSFDAILRGMVDNAVSRFVGLWVRIFAVIAAVFLTGFASLVGIVLIGVWPLLPPLGLFMLFRSALP